MKLTKYIASAVLTVGMTVGAAQAGTIGIFGDIDFNGSSANTINDIYNTNTTPNTHTSSLLGSLNGTSVAGIDLLWLLQPETPYSAGELATLNGYIDDGGRIAFLGEHGNIAPTQNNNINTALSALGSTMSINNLILDGGFQDATRLDGQIQNDPLTDGVDTYNYAAYAPINVGSGVNLMFGSDLTTSMMAFENVRAGSIFMITDQNVFDSANNTGSNDNGILFDNLVEGDTQNPNNPNVVPLPAAGWMLIAGIGGLAAMGRRRKSA